MKSQSLDAFQTKCCNFWCVNKKMTTSPVVIFRVNFQEKIILIPWVSERQIKKNIEKS